MSEEQSQVCNVVVVESEVDMEPLKYFMWEKEQLSGTTVWLTTSTGTMGTRGEI